MNVSLHTYLEKLLTNYLKKLTQRHLAFTLGNWVIIRHHMLMKQSYDMLTKYKRDWLKFRALVSFNNWGLQIIVSSVTFLLTFISSVTFLTWFSLWKICLINRKGEPLSEIQNATFSPYNITQHVFKHIEHEHTFSHVHA